MNQELMNHETPRTSGSQTSSVVYITPSLSPKDKKRIDSADEPFNKSRCLIQNYSDDRTVQYCHMVSRKHAKDEQLMMALEWHWNMPYKSLHLNTRYNVFFVGSTLRFYRDSGAWGLIPSDKTIIDRYYDALAVGRSSFPDIQLPQNGFEYRLIPLDNSMKNYPILRQNEHALLMDKEQFTLHFYPFESLPTLRSHLHPKFAIFELGRKFGKVRGDESAVAISLYPDLVRVFLIYAAWMLSPRGERGFREWRNEGGKEGDGDCQSETSMKTGCDSLREGGSKRKQGGGNAGWPPPASVTAPAGGNSNVMGMANSSRRALTRRALIEHEGDRGKGGWTPDRLSSWVVDASRDVTSWHEDMGEDELDACSVRPEED